MDTDAKLNLTVLALIALVLVYAVASLVHGNRTAHERTYVASAPVAQVIVSAKRLSAAEKAALTINKSV